MHRRFVDGNTRVRVRDGDDVSVVGSYFVSSEKDSFGEIRALHFAEIARDNRARGLTGVTVKLVGGDWKLYHLMWPGEVGLLVSVPGDGVYEVKVNSQPYCNQKGSHFEVAGGEAFFADSLNPCPDEGIAPGILVIIIVVPIVIIVIIVLVIVEWKTGIFWRHKISREKKVPLLEEAPMSHMDADLHL
jgi:hypothetical protein